MDDDKNETLEINCGDVGPTIERATQEREADKLPALAGSIDNWADYDVIFCRSGLFDTPSSLSMPSIMAPLQKERLLFSVINNTLLDDAVSLIIDNIAD